MKATQHVQEVELADAVVSLDLPVRFAETDAMGVVHHSVYVIWFEIGRVAWMDAVGMPYAEVAAGGNHFAVTGIDATYRSPARFGDLVRVETRPTRLRSRQVHFAYQVHHALGGELLATGASRHICVSDSGQMAQIPQQVMTRLQTGINRLVGVTTG